MNIESELTLSYYKNIADINRDHGVFLVQHTQTGRIYVKKVMTVYNIKVFAHLQKHPIPGLPVIRELVEDDCILTIIEDYITGETLEDILSRRGKLPEEETINIISQLCVTVDSMHSFNPPMIHRDIKPSNVIITPEGSAILLDMNAAKFDDGSGSEDTMLLGTKGFAAPEQYGFGTSGVPADIYALGMLMNTMLTGTVSREEVATGSLSRVITKCLEMNPKDRYASVYQLRQAINRKDYRMRYLPPGFRNGNLLHMIVSLAMYTSILITLSGVATSPNGLVANIIGVIGFGAGFAVIIAFTFDYLGFRRNVAPFLYRYNPWIRAVLIAVIDAGIAVASILITIILIILLALITGEGLT